MAPPDKSFDQSLRIRWDLDKLFPIENYKRYLLGSFRKKNIIIPHSDSNCATGKNIIKTVFFGRIDYLTNNSQYGGRAKSTCDF